MKTIFQRQNNLLLRQRMEKGEWEEAKHPRGPGGKFGSGGGDKFVDSTGKEIDMDKINVPSAIKVGKPVSISHGNEIERGRVVSNNGETAVISVKAPDKIIRTGKDITLLQGNEIVTGKITGGYPMNYKHEYHYTVKWPKKQGHERI